jgi:hypothetical protein|tara:strand:+ start:897 stop:1499 length:603 start_codon:yes stop_codon:yes gene_type:complete
MNRPFANTTLTDIFLLKLAKLERNTFFAGYEEMFEQKCRQYSVPFVKRSRRSSLVDEPASEIYSFLKDVSYDYLLQVSACIPFLRSKTILDFLEACASDRRPAFGVFKVKDYFTHLDGTPINFPDTLMTINTKAVAPVYEFGHVFYFFRRDYFLDTGWYWDWNEVRYIEIPIGLETFDIDSEEEFFMAETLWKEIGHSVT